MARSSIPRGYSMRCWHWNSTARPPPPSSFVFCSGCVSKCNDALLSRGSNIIIGIEWRRAVGSYPYVCLWTARRYLQCRSIWDSLLSDHLITRLKRPKAELFDMKTTWRESSTTFTWSIEAIEEKGESGEEGEEWTTAGDLWKIYWSSDWRPIKDTTEINVFPGISHRGTSCKWWRNLESRRKYSCTRV